MKYSEYAKWTNRATQWIEQHFATLRERPVRAQVAPGDIAALLSPSPPEQGEDMALIMEDFERVVMPGITHWQHPRFFAYFPSNASPPAILADFLTSTMAVNSLLWQTSPAATEIEEVMIDWFRQALDLPTGFKGVIQDSASSATLSAVLTIRERATGFTGNDQGISGQPKMRIYCSEQVHSSIDKACWVAGIGQDNLVKIATNSQYQMDPTALQTAIDADRAAGHTPAGLILCTGGTSIGACDDLPPLIKIAQSEDLYTHLDAAWAGSAMICPELRDIWAGAGDCDSIVFNPHKWLGANFDCSIQFLKDANIQRRTMGLRPSYLETPQAAEITNFNEWTVPLGRRFRALKLWFLVRAYGLEGLRDRMRNHVKWAQELEAKISEHPDFTITTASRLSLFTFQHTPKGSDPNEASAELLQKINDDGRIYLDQLVRSIRDPLRCGPI